MAKRQSPHAKMKDLLGRLARVPKHKVEDEERKFQVEQQRLATLPRTQRRAMFPAKKTG